MNTLAKLYLILMIITAGIIFILPFGIWYYYKVASNLYKDITKDL